MRDAILHVKFHPLGKCDNPVELCRIPSNCHHHFPQLNGDPLPFRGFSSLRNPNTLVIYREIKPELIQRYSVMPHPVFLELEHLEEFKRKSCSGVFVSFRQKKWDPTKISNGEPRLVNEVVVDRGRVLVRIRVILAEIQREILNAVSLEWME
jgi:hypothetical protein